MDRLIQDLLDVTRVETGRLVIEPEPVAVDALLDDALETLRPLLDEAGLTLAEDYAAGLPKVNADRQRVAQVLSNLVGNAIKATMRGGRVTIRARGSAEGVQVEVEDSGGGIAAEQLSHIFDRFWQSERSSIRTRGAGLGLPIAKGIVEAHGGRMWVTSTPGVGTTVYFTLPPVAQ
jgi:signal transduction histidine kinase